MFKGVTTVMINYTSFYTEISCKLGTPKKYFGNPRFDNDTPTDCTLVMNREDLKNITYCNICENQRPLFQRIFTWSESNLTHIQRFITQKEHTDVILWEFKEEWIWFVQYPVTDKKIMQTLSLCHDYLPAIKTRWMILFDWAFYKPHVYQLTSDIYDSWVICTSSAKGQRWPLVLLSLLCQGH